jgi:hypothetical protein
MAVQQPPHRQPMGGQLRGHLRQQPPLIYDPVYQILVHVGEAQRGHAGVGVVLPPRPERLAMQRRRYAEQRITARVAELGFPGLRAYLADRLLERDWLLVEVAAELVAHQRTVRRLMVQAGVRRDRRTARQLAVGERGRRVQSASWQRRRAARLAELGFADLGGYLQRRYVEQGWPVKRMRAELQVGHNWLVAQMESLGIR